MIKRFILWLPIFGALLLLALQAPSNVLAEQTIPVGEFVNVDGTLNLTTGKSGGLDLRGWNIRLDPLRGPQFSQAAPTTSNWAGLSNGVNTFVRAIAVIGSDVYVGGDFGFLCSNTDCSVENTRVNHIAKWSATSSTWSAVGKGVDGGVEALAVSGNDIYVGGAFTHVCGNITCDSGNVQVNNIAKWSTTSNTFTALGKGLDGFVRALAVSGNTVYVGGTFHAFCGNLTCNQGNTEVNYIAKWNGSSWAGLDNGVVRVSDPSITTVYALAVSGTDLYVGGEFTHLCGNVSCTSGNTPVNYIAKWSSATSTWSKLGNGLAGQVDALAVSGSTVYAGGFFGYICGNAACNQGNTLVFHIAKWNGSSWTPLQYGVYGAVDALVVDGNNVYVGGQFGYICGNQACNSGFTPARSIALWNGSSWTALGAGFDNMVFALAMGSSKLYAGGAFANACGNASCDSGNTQVNYAASYAVSSGCTTKPSQPTLGSPANKATVNKTRPRLQWNAAPCAQTYSVTVQEAKTGKQVDNATNLTTLMHKTVKLIKGKSYKWFVQACNGFGCAQSVMWKFSVQ